MRILKIFFVILVVALAIITFGRYNLKISYKYEVDLMETNIKTDSLPDVIRNERQKQLDNRRKEITDQQSRLTIFFWIVLVSLTLTSVSLVYKKIKP